MNLNIIRTPILEEPDPRGIGYVFYSKMQQANNNIAQIDTVTGNTETYASLLKRCTRVAIKLRSKGITPEDVVISCTYNHMDCCLPPIATSFIGGKISALDPTLSVGDVAHLLKEVTPKIIFVIHESVQLIEEALSQVSDDVEIVVFGKTDKYTPFSEFLQPSEEEHGFKPYEVTDPEETAIILFSSGTSGLSKGICLNHNYFLSQIDMMTQQGYDYSVTLVTTSLYWITAYIFFSVSTFLGTTRIVIPQFELPLIITTIDTYKPSLIFTTPIYILDIINYGIPADKNMASLKHILTAGVPVLPKQILLMRKAFPKANIFPFYGQTEVMVVAFFKADEAHLVLNDDVVSSGKLFPGITSKVVDVETEEAVGPNERGELRLQTQFKINGYYKRDFSEVWDSNGWYRTGDVVYYDENRCFYIVDRIKEMLKYRTWHVPPAAIENVLLTHPAVEKCVVIGVPHEIDGDHPMGLVVLKNSHKETTSEEIKKFVNDRVDDRKQLRGGLKIVDSFPVQSTGKIKKRLIRDMVLRGEI